MSARCQNHAGILRYEDDTLTETAKRKFIEDVINELAFGSPSLNICGDNLSAVPFADMQDLYDEQKYPEWHKTWPPKYEEMARALNVKGGMPFFPFCDLTVFLDLFGVNIAVPLPKFPPTVTLPELLLPHLPDLDIGQITLKLPSPLPPELELPKLPDIPTLDFRLPDLQFSLNALFQLPMIILDPFPPDISLVLKLFDIPSLMVDLCKKVREKAFPPHTNAGGIDLSNIAAMMVLSRKCVELTTIAFAACVVGSSPNGVVGSMGANSGYREPPFSSQEKQALNETTVDKIISAAESGVGLHSSRNQKHAQILRQYADFLFPDPEDRVNDRHVLAVSNPKFSSCGMFLRAVFRKAGGGSVGDMNLDMPYFTRSAQAQASNKGDSGGPVVSDLIALAKRKNALKYDPSTLPTANLMDINLKPGDGLLISSEMKGGYIDAARTHVLLLGEDKGSAPKSTHMSERNRVFVSYEGGAPNVVAKPGTVGVGKDEAGNYLEGGQRILKSQYTLQQWPKNGNPIMAFERQVFYIFDGEKMMG